MERIDIIARAQQTVGNGYGEDGVVGKCAVRSKQRKVFPLGSGPLVDGTDHVSRDRAKHADLPLAIANSTVWDPWLSRPSAPRTGPREWYSVAIHPCYPRRGFCYSIVIHHLLFITGPMNNILAEMLFTSAEMLFKTAEMLFICYSGFQGSTLCMNEYHF
jgi:hypothetical protein